MEAKDDKDTVPPRRSSWSAAIAQLPGYPEASKPVLPQAPAGPVREVSMGSDHDEPADGV
jgi:hypothetical protein